MLPPHPNQKCIGAVFCPNMAAGSWFRPVHRYTTQVGRECAPFHATHADSASKICRDKRERGKKSREEEEEEEEEEEGGGIGK